MQFAGIPDDLVGLIQGIIIFLVAAERIIKTLIIKLFRVKGGENA